MGRQPGSKPTSFDIAYLAGVSQPTVSRALRGSRSVSLATRQRIEAIARDLNYSVDKNASSLRSQRSNTIALLFFEDPTPDESNINPFFLAMLGAITRQCGARGLDLLISFQKMEHDWHVRYQDSHRADGLILLGYGDYRLYERRLTDLVGHGTHFVRWGSVGEGMIGPTVGSDNVGAGRLAGAHLLDLGRRHIAFLGHADGHYPEFADRYAGLCQAMAERGVAPDATLQVDALTAEDAGDAAARTLIARGTPFDAIFAASDLIAIGAMRALAEAGLSVPGDVAIIGFDDIPTASLTSPPLTTIMQDMKGAGQLLVDTLVCQIEATPLPPSTLPVRLVVRKSTGG
ncbi:LacI family DNA-binding transcriptional regulator [Sphingobium sp. HBC34]|uniref:LacI family DNA-binding transcriptional regulator n=1 Tax=Sphingobium cyanobacteriorum TaxID=3063954 RepID=A0ABT8ZLQ8_9SPHN|nr:LacI family DNA-binding transcriptional regulator [Sphingobium sp. HBC34]MDO7835482.1 LacI family DNA-binding transcriptional regulator [Sphingobium sp. HBC34]